MNLHARRTSAFLSLLLASTALFSACDDDSPDEATARDRSNATSEATTDSDIDDLVIGPGAIGRARVGMNRAEWTRTGLFEDGAVLCGGELIHWAADPKAEKLLVVNATDGTIGQMFVSAPGPHTAHGDIEVGSTYAELKAAYGNLTKPVADGFGETSSVYPPGEEDGRAYLGFLLDDLPENVDDDTTIARIAVTGGEKPYFQYDC